MEIEIVGIYYLSNIGSNITYVKSNKLKFLAKQLTLFQPGGQIIPTTILRAPPDFQTLQRAWQSNERNWILTDHVTFNQIYQMKTTMMFYPFKLAKGVLILSMHYIAPISK